MQVIVADNQPIFREGLVRVLTTDPTIEIVAQCVDINHVARELKACPGAIVLFSSSFTTDPVLLLNLIQQAEGYAVLMLDSSAVAQVDLSHRLSGVIVRSVAKQQLLECMYRVASGGRFVQRAMLEMPLPSDRLCPEIVRRLTPKELQIVALISEGRRNKAIAMELGTKEQVIKNYLRSIYCKCGVSDRLELALFTVRHQLLSKSAETAQPELARSA